MKKYDNYKDSGIEWIGEIPNHWEVSSIKFLAKIQNGSTPSSSVEEFWNGDINWVTTDDLGKLKVKEITKTKRTITQLGYESCGTSLAPIGSIVLSTRAPIGHIGILNIEACSNQGCKTIIPTKINSTFCYFYFLKSKEILESLGQGSTFKELPTPTLKDFKVVFPNLEEQNQIANYLDHKTTQIDTLISKKKQFITLLQEERIAVINQAVTKGLDPKVKMKDSGIEWLGEIPEHWEVKRLRNLVETIKTGSTPPSEEIQYFEPKEINWYGPGDFDNLILGSSKRKISKLAIDENKCRLFPAKSILLIGIGATVGKVGLALEDCSSNQQINAIILKDDYNPTFYLYFLSTIKDIIVMEASSATLPIFNQTQTKNIITPVPPTKEQIEISDFIRNQEIRIEAIISKSQQEIEVLKEYKTALISEVVTGKVDVRNEVLN